MENDDDQSTRSNSSQSRGRGRYHRNSYYNNPSSLPGGRGGHRQHAPEVRGTFRFRNPDDISREIEPESAPVEDTRQERHHRSHRHGFYSMSDEPSSRSHGRRHHGHHRNHQPREDMEDPIEKEKEMHKVSLLDGIEEMLKKIVPEKNLASEHGAAAIDGASNCSDFNAKSKQFEEEDNIDTSRKPHKPHGGRHSYGKEGYYQSKVLQDDSSFNENAGREHRRNRHQNRNYSKSRHDKVEQRQEAHESFFSGKSHKGRHKKYSDEPEKDFDQSNRGGFRKHNYKRMDERDNNDDEVNNGNTTKSSRFSNSNALSRNKVYPSAPKAKAPIDEDATQRERLTEQLESRDFECMVCCETVRHRDSIWNCIKCFNIFHLNCITKWARTPTAVVEGAGWRCPTCQDITETIPAHYYCFCGKVRDPELNRHDTPHSCGNVCHRSRQIKGCSHPCNILCHPGPCPPCSTMVTRKCECGKIEMQVKCGRAKSLTCDGVCEKLLNCGAHKCKTECHPGPCVSCTSIVPQKCYCSKSSREVPCTEESSNSSRFICEEMCGKKLGCEEHQCDLYCHDGDCPPCELLPSIVRVCPCGKKSISELMNGGNRLKCTDEVPTCKNNCLKVLNCGPEDVLHMCYSKCHLDKCPPCPLKTEVRCRCGVLVKNVLCSELDIAQPLTCERRCNKKKHCGRHKCLNLCCIDIEHVCELTCNRMQSCGLHRCPELCHKGNCRTCSNVSFEDLYCDCGSQMVMAPVACGLKPPECDQACSRDHSCDHPVQHNCHSEENCPPCTAFTEKFCFGRHEKRSHVPCFLESLSCGRLCGKPLSCGQHVCQKTCHEGNCESEDPNQVQCTQPCLKKRPECEHPCAAPCHQGPCCLDNPCKTLIQLTCECGTRSEKVPCADNVKLYKQVSASILASKMQDIQLGNTVDISDVLGSSVKKNKLGKLDCNEECSAVERNRRLALALQIRNPDLSTVPGPPKYSDFLKEEYKKNGSLVRLIFDKLTELVQLAKQSKQKSRSHSFSPMNRDHRRVVHELAEFFGCETESFDQEPKRNVVITAFRDRSYLPSTSITAVVEREMGMRKAPPPLLSSANSSKADTSSADKSSAEKVIDYFDF